MRHTKQTGIRPGGSVVIELFGMARISCGRRDVEIELPPDGGMERIVEVLADACPALVGLAIREDRTGLLDSYTFNLNGTTFVSSDTTRLCEGDRLLLFSSLAGG
jgi:molybdopterin converting factor small subunit